MCFRKVDHRTVGNHADPNEDPATRIRGVVDDICQLGELSAREAQVLQVHEEGIDNSVTVRVGHHRGLGVVSGGGASERQVTRGRCIVLPCNIDVANVGVD